MRIHKLNYELWLPQPREVVFSFFSNAQNLDRITPPWLDFRILTPSPMEIQKGSFIDYQLRLYGVALNWRSEITVWEPPEQFVDVQRKGPYSQWIHEHNFIEQDGGTLVQDLVIYRLYGWIVEPLIYLFVKRELEKIFAFRKEKMLEIFHV